MIPAHAPAKERTSGRLKIAEFLIDPLLPEFDNDVVGCVPDVMIAGRRDFRALK
jgi:hypothetical protein